MSTWTAEDGSEFYFEMFGGRDPDKPVLLLLPGWLGSISSQWRNFVKPLSADYRIVLVDLRGHGRSQNKASGLSANQMLADIIGLLDYLQIPEVHITGYNLGGYLGLMMSLAYPRRVQTLIMHASKFYWSAEAVKGLQTQLNPDVMAEKVPAYANQLVQEHGARQWRELVRQVGMLAAELSENGIKESQLKNIQCPVLVSVGDRDELVPLPEAQRLSRVLPKGELIVLPGVRHPYATLRQIPLLPMMQHFHKEG